MTVHLWSWMFDLIMECGCILYSGKLSREKTFTNFAIFQPSTKVFSLKSFPLYGSSYSVFNYYYCDSRGRRKKLEWLYTFAWRMTRAHSQNDLPKSLAVAMVTACCNSHINFCVRIIICHF